MVSVASWQFWAVCALVALVLEFAVSGVGMLALSSSAMGVTALILYFGLLGSYGQYWQATVLLFVVLLIVCAIVARKFWRRRDKGPDINKY